MVFYKVDSSKTKDLFTESDTFKPRLSLPFFLVRLCLFNFCVLRIGFGNTRHSTSHITLCPRLLQNLDMISWNLPHCLIRVLAIHSFF